MLTSVPGNLNCIFVFFETSMQRFLSKWKGNLRIQEKFGKI